MGQYIEYCRLGSQSSIAAADAVRLRKSWARPCMLSRAELCNAKARLDLTTIDLGFISWSPESGYPLSTLKLPGFISSKVCTEQLAPPCLGIWSLRCPDELRFGRNGIDHCLPTATSFGASIQSSNSGAAYRSYFSDARTFITDLLIDFKIFVPQLQQEDAVHAQAMQWIHFWFSR